jgi:lycopene cyclase domain-containing protein
MYLIALLVSLAGLTTLDWRHKLAFFGERKRALLTLAVPYMTFVAWDTLGIAFHIFFRGNTSHLTGITLFPEFPIEELFFLGVLCYTALLLTSRFASKK